jgi:hypothetical protein
MKKILFVSCLLSISAVAFADQSVTCALTSISNPSVFGQIEKHFSNGQLTDVKFSDVNIALDSTNSSIRPATADSIVLVSNSDLSNACSEKVIVGGSTSGNMVTHLVQCKPDFFTVSNCK